MKVRSSSMLMHSKIEYRCVNRTFNNMVRSVNCNCNLFPYRPVRATGTNVLLIHLLVLALYTLFACLLSFPTYFRFMAALRSRRGNYILPLWFFSFFFFLAYSQQLQIGWLPYFHTWCCLSANVECRSEMCCTRLADNIGRKNYEKNRRLCTIAQCCWAGYRDFLCPRPLVLKSKRSLWGTGNIRVPATFRFREQSSRDFLFPGPFVPRNFRSQDFLFPGTFVPNNNYSWDLSFSGFCTFLLYCCSFQKIKRWWLCNVHSCCFTIK